MQKLTGAKGKVGGVSLTDGHEVLTKVKTIAISATGTTGEVDTSYDVPTKALIQDCWAIIHTAATAAATLSVGILSSSSGGDATGFLNAVGASSTGLVRGVFTASSSGSPDWFWSANTKGSLLSTFNAGTTAASDFGVAGDKTHPADSVTAKSVSYTWNSTDTAARATVCIVMSEYSS